MPHVKQLKEMRRYFETGATQSLDFRKEQLRKLQSALEKYESEIYQALYTDLKKSKEESWVTELGFVMGELKHALKHLHKWNKRRKVSTNLMNFPSSSYIYKEPHGVVLIIGPWNYPVNLLFTPLVGAIAAGNCVMLKASEFSMATSAIMERIIAESFESNYISITMEDGEKVIPHMMQEFIFDHVFFTGSTSVGQKIYAMAAENLVPVTLELGGKSPCIVEEEADITVAAKRIVSTKFSNTGQMCVAPDYVLVHKSNQDALLNAMKDAIHNFFGKDPSASNDFGKIINEKQFDRLTHLLKDGTVVYGGETDRSKLYIAPTLIVDVSPGAKIMQEEIFGPLLPVIPFTTKEAAKEIIASNKNPLAFYVFTSNKEKEDYWLNTVAFGGGCVNNAALHLTNYKLPFGGRGASGIGNYHGKHSFDTFSHSKAVMVSPTWFDPAAKYPPFAGKLKLLKWITG